MDRILSFVLFASFLQLSVCPTMASADPPRLQQIVELAGYQILNTEDPSSSPMEKPLRLDSTGQYPIVALSTRISRVNETSRKYRTDAVLWEFAYRLREGAVIEPEIPVRMSNYRYVFSPSGKLLQQDRGASIVRSQGTPFLSAGFSSESRLTDDAVPGGWVMLLVVGEGIHPGEPAELLAYSVVRLKSGK